MSVQPAAPDAATLPSPPFAVPHLARRMACWLYEGMLLFGVVFISVLIRTMLAPRDQIQKIANLPLEEDNE